MNTVLVTGGAGFIGSHLVEALVKEGTAVRVLDDLSTGSLEYLAGVRSQIELIRGDVADMAVVRRATAGVSHVIHLAAMRSIPRSLDDPALCNQVNVAGTLNVFLATREVRAQRVVFASSSAVYGDVETYPVSEDHPTHPLTPYAVTKLVGELYARMFREINGSSIVCLRYFNVYGPRMDATSQYAMAVPRFIACLLNDLPPPVFGDGRQSRDFTCIDNVVHATRKALYAPDMGPDILNVGDGREYSVLDLVAILNRLMGKQIAPRHLPAIPGESRRTLADIARAKQSLQYEPQVGFEEGLAKTIEWFRQHPVSPSVPTA